MDVLDLEDFEYQALISSVLNGKKVTVLDFSPMIVFLLDWAYENDWLDSNYFEQHIGTHDYLKLRLSEICFKEFVVEKMNSRLSLNFFKSEVSGFIQDYVEYDGYIGDLTIVFKTNIGDLPETLEATSSLYEQINESRNNYLANKKRFPDLVVFRDPEQLLKEQSRV